MRAPVTFALLLTACAGRSDGLPDGPSMAPTSNVFLRNSFDTDPSVYLGRFLPRGLSDLDEGSAMPLSCSTHITYRFIEAGGVKVSETMNVSTQVAARLGVPLVAEVKGSGERRAEVRVEYTLTGKMVADIADPSAFNECCKAQPDQCTDRYIGEFLQGTGAVFREQAREADVSASGRDPNSGVSGGVGVSHQKQWAQAIEFPNPVYFAFKVTPTIANRATSSCGDWVEKPPTEPGFVFFVGMSRESRNERQARERALRRAQMTAFGSVAQISTDVDDDLDSMEDPAAEQWARSMQVVESCVEVVPGSKGERFIGRVLGRLPAYEGTGTSAPAPAPEPEPDELDAPDPSEDPFD